MRGVRSNLSDSLKVHGVRASAPSNVRPTDELRLIFKPELLRLIGVSYSTLLGWMRAGKFPLARELGPGGGRSCKIAWLESEVAAWLASRPQRKIKPLPGGSA
jgi:predicted DNA-binding transcriptional regulator AlpA